MTLMEVLHLGQGALGVPSIFLSLWISTTADNWDFNKFNTNASFITSPTISIDELNGIDRGIGQGIHIEDDDVLGSMILNPFEDREHILDNNTVTNYTVTNSSSDGTNCNMASKIEYNNNIIVRIVYIPAFIILFLSSGFLIYTILKFLKPLVKIYMSVLFYAGCQLFLAACLILSLISSKLYDQSMLTCRITEPLQSVGIIMPGYAVLAITFIRYMFLKYPMQWRNVLSMPRQFSAFSGLILFACLISNLPNMGLCDYMLYTKGGLVQCRYSKTGILCTTFYAIYITFGFALPPVLVIILYGLVYKIISKHRTYRQENSRSRGSSGYRTVSSHSTRLNTTDSLLDSSTDQGKEDIGAEQERSDIPWSILVIMVLNLLSTLPWIPQALYPDLFYGCQPGEIVLLVDILWSVLLIAIAVSPVSYLVTTQSVRLQLQQHLCPCVDTDSKYRRSSSL